MAASYKASSIPEDEFCFWSKSELNILNKHQTYHKEMVNYIEKLKNKGQSDFVPVKPASKLPIPFKKSSKLNSEKFHEYLENKISMDNASSKAPDVPEETTYENLMSYLKKCVEHENAVDKKGLKSHCDNGTVLEEIFCRVERGKSKWKDLPQLERMVTRKYWNWWKRCKKKKRICKNY